MLWCSVRSGGKFRKVPESSGVCYCRFRRQVPERSGELRCGLLLPRQGQPSGCFEHLLVITLSTWAA